jgi:hypothetical protein
MPPVTINVLTASYAVHCREKMTHGTIPWEGKNDRRTLFYKYVPFGMHHADAGYDVNDPELTAHQREVVEFSETWFNAPRTYLWKRNTLLLCVYS